MLLSYTLSHPNPWHPCCFQFCFLVTFFLLFLATHTIYSDYLNVGAFHFALGECSPVAARIGKSEMQLMIAGGQPLLLHKDVGDVAGVIAEGTPRHTEC